MYERLYAKGIAVGESNIREGTITFRHRARLFILDAADALTVGKYNGYFYEARVKSLKALQRKLGKKKQGEPHG